MAEFKNIRVRVAKSFINRKTQRLVVMLSPVDNDEIQFYKSWPVNDLEWFRKDMMLIGGVVIPQRKAEADARLATITKELIDREIIVDVIPKQKDDGTVHNDVYFVGLA